MSLALAVCRLNNKIFTKNHWGNLKIPAVSNTLEYVTEVHATSMHTLSTSMLCTKQM